MSYLRKACTSALGHNTRLKLTTTLHAKIKLLPDKTNQLPLPIQSPLMEINVKRRQSTQLKTEKSKKSVEKV